MAQKNKKKKRKLRVKILLRIFLFILIVAAIIYYFYNLKIQNIYIKGNDVTKDIEIIKKAQIENYPDLYRLNLKKIKKDVESLPLINKATIKRTPFGKITITVTEEKVLFYYKYANKVVTSKGNLVADDNKYQGLPTLINFTPDTIFEELVKGLNKLDPNIIPMIGSIEYTPFKSSEGKVIDDTQFKLIMNDLNTVIIDTENIKRLNQYNDIYASLNMDVTKGILYLDTITEENILFESYDSIKQSTPEEPVADSPTTPEQTEQPTQ